MEPLFGKKQSDSVLRAIPLDIFDIKRWENTLTLPEMGDSHAPAVLKIENQLQFTFVKQEDQQARVFISEKTHLIELLKLLPFLFTRYQLYACLDRLIEERLEGLNQEGTLTGSNQATKLLKFILEKAVLLNASDIHLESLPIARQVRIRVDGNLQLIETPARIEENVFTKVKLVSRMDIAQKRSPQDGHFHYVSDRGKRFDLRTSTIPGVNGEKIVIRLLPATSVMFSLSHLGLMGDHIQTIQKTIRKKSGLILFTGPTGSGKTTSLYAILNELMAESLNIVTIEDPVECRIEAITQVEVNELAEVTFSAALRSFLRQDPDVILIGEIRDSETAQIAARAAQTGHLVLSTLHSNTVFEAIHRLKTLGVQGEDLSSSLRLIISQRLMSKKCACDNDTENCSACDGRGFSGRVPLLEMLSIDDQIRKQLAAGASVTEIKKVADESKFQSLRQNGIQLVRQGVISETELDAICL